MKKILAIISGLCIILLIVISASGCAQRVASKMIEKAIEKSAAEAGQDVDIDLNEGEVRITDEEGNEMSIGGADLPSDWPSVVPVNNNIEIQSSFSQTTDGKKGWTIVGKIKNSAAEMYEYYKNTFSSWGDISDFTSDQGDDGKTYSFQASGDKYTVTLFILENDNEKSITLSVSEN